MQREKLKRLFRKAADAAKTCEVAAPGLAHQEAWEAWTKEWRVAADLGGKYGASINASAAAINTAKAYRLSSPALNYIWEAGNIERHDLDGSSDRMGGGVVLKPAAMGEPMILHGLRIVDGVLSADAAFNVQADFTPSQLALKPVTTRSGKVVAPPEGTSISDLLKAGQDHLGELSRILFPRF